MRDRPNVLWIYCDELRADALGCYGHPVIKPKTPRLDELASNGVLYEQCFVNSPVCVPSRVSTLTGQHCEQTGVYHNEACWPKSGEAPVSLPTFPQAFANAGYATANFGKTHYPKPYDPWQHSDYRGGGMGELTSVVPRHDPSVITPPGVPTLIGGRFPGGQPYPADEVATNAIEWMGQQDGPFFARVSILQPHTPVYPPPPFDELFMHSDLDGNWPKRPNVSRFEKRHGAVLATEQMSPENIRLAKVYYYGLVAWIDMQVGRLLDHLAQAGQLDNTVIVFSADHGAALGEGGRWAKQVFAPEVQRVPLIVSQPGVLPKGQRRKEVTENRGIGRTLLDLCNLDVPESIGGPNLIDDPPTQVFSTIGYGLPGSTAFPNIGIGNYSNTQGWPRRACVRDNRFRLDRNVKIDGQPVGPSDRDVFFCDYRSNPAEDENQIDNPQFADALRRLSASLDAHLATAVEPSVERFVR